MDQQKTYREEAIAGSIPKFLTSSEEIVSREGDELHAPAARS